MEPGKEIVMKKLLSVIIFLFCFNIFAYSDDNEAKQYLQKGDKKAVSGAGLSGIPFEDKSGIIKISGKTEGGLKVEIEGHKIRYPEEYTFTEYNFGDYADIKNKLTWPKDYLISLKVKVNEKKIDLPYSSLWGIFEPHYVKFEPGDGNEFKIRIFCRDASYAYEVDLFFKNRSLYKRMVYSDCNTPIEETAYTQCVIE